MLLANKANVDFIAKDGCTPLTFAAVMGHKDIAETLLTHKANVDLANSRGVTPLIMAAWHDNEDVVETLLGACATICRFDNQHKHITKCMELATNIDSAFAVGQYATIEEGTNLANLYIARYKSLLIKHGFYSPVQMELAKISQTINNTEIQNNLYNFIVDGVNKIDMIIGLCFDALYPQINSSAPLHILLANHSRFKTDHASSIPALISLYTELLGEEFNPPEAEKTKESDDSLGSLDDSLGSLDDILSLSQVYIHKANVKILTKNMTSYIAQALTSCTLQGAQFIELLKALKGQYALPKALVETLDSNLSSYEDTICNPISRCVIQNNSQAIIALHKSVMQQQKQSEEQQARFEEQQKKLDSIELLLNSLRSNHQSDMAIDNTGIDIAGKTPDMDNMCDDSTLCSQDIVN